MNKNKCFICDKTLDNFKHVVYVKHGYDGISHRMCSSCGSVLEQNLVWWKQDRKLMEVSCEIKQKYYAQCGGAGFVYNHRHRDIDSVSTIPSAQE